mgnify:CR=1 FL=1
MYRKDAEKECPFLVLSMFPLVGIVSSSIGSELVSLVFYVAVSCGLEISKAQIVLGVRFAVGEELAWFQVLDRMILYVEEQRY